MTDSEHGFTQVTAVASEYEMSHHQVYPTDQDALRSKGSDGQAEERIQPGPTKIAK